jgi:hypothetical protein
LNAGSGTEIALLLEAQEEVRKMTMPGFTAEKSMIRTGGQYKRNTNLADSSGGVTITPQRMKLTTVHCDCDEATDICVCDNGRVLHDVLGNI